MSSLKCPKCADALETITYQGMTVERCRGCAGIWFARCEIDVIKALQGSEAVDIGDYQAEAASSSLPQEFCCPQCRQVMLRILDLDQFAIWYEKCLNCQGVWLDAGEFSQYKQNFQSKSLLDRARMALGFGKNNC